VPPSDTDTSVPVNRLAALVHDLPAPRRRSDAFATEAFLADLLAGPGPNDAEAVRRLDRLCKKVDVVGRVSAFYTPDLARSAEAEPIATPYATALAAALLLAAEARGDLKFLNTALKILDGRLGDAGGAYPPWLAAWAERMLARPWSAFRQGELDDGPAP